jgi:transposase
LDATSWEQTPLGVRQVVIHLLAVIQQQQERIAALEARLSQNSRNSDRPPSSDPPYVQRIARSGARGRPGAKPGHPGHRQAWLAPTEVIEVTPEACACGQRAFLETQPYQTHQVIELPEIQTVVTHVVLHETRCPRCGRTLKAALPAAYRYGYGPRMTALIGELSGSQRSSRSAVQEFCASVLGVPISRGAIQRAVDRVSTAITPHYEAIGAKARGAKVNYIDETAWHQHGVLAWLWVMANTTIAFFTVQTSRSKAAFEALVERWAGILVSDGYGVYCHWMHQRQICLAHLIRRARRLSERQEPDIAWFGRRVLAEL